MHRMLRTDLAVHLMKEILLVEIIRMLKEGKLKQRVFIPMQKITIQLPLVPHLMQVELAL